MHGDRQAAHRLDAPGVELHFFASATRGRAAAAASRAACASASCRTDSITPRRFTCLPDAATSATSLPHFTSLRYGDPGYCQLRRATARVIREGADDGGEMGVMHALFQPQREPTCASGSTNTCDSACMRACSTSPERVVRRRAMATDLSRVRKQPAARLRRRASSSRARCCSMPTPTSSSAIVDRRLRALASDVLGRATVSPTRPTPFASRWGRRARVRKR